MAKTGSHTHQRIYTQIMVNASKLQARIFRNVTGELGIYRIERVNHSLHHTNQWQILTQRPV